MLSYYGESIYLNNTANHFKRRLIEQAPIRSDQRVLDLSCGTGMLLVLLTPPIRGHAPRLVHGQRRGHELHVYLLRKISNLISVIRFESGEFFGSYVLFGYT